MQPLVFIYSIFILKMAKCSFHFVMLLFPIHITYLLCYRLVALVVIVCGKIRFLYYENEDFLEYDHLVDCWLIDISVGVFLVYFFLCCFQSIRLWTALHHNVIAYFDKQKWKYSWWMCFHCNNNNVNTKKREESKMKNYSPET